MSDLSLLLRRGLTATLLVAAGAASSAGAANAATLETTATCTFPTVGEQTVTVAIDLPEGLKGGNSVPSATLTKLNVSPAVLALGATVSLERGTELRFEHKYPNSAPYLDGVFPQGPLPLPPESVTGISTFPPGVHSATLKSLRLSVKVVDAAGTVVLPGDSGTDGDESTFDVPCVLAPVAPVEFTVGPADAVYDMTPPSAPTDFKVTSKTPTTASFSWTASEEVDGTVDRYAIYAVRTDDTSEQPKANGYSTRKTEAVLTRLAPDTEYEVLVRAYNRNAQQGDATKLTFRTPAAVTPAAPKGISNYRVTGAFALWVEPRTEGNPERIACVATSPTISFTAAGYGATPLNQTTLGFQGWWTGNWGLPVPFAEARPFALFDGNHELRASAQLGLLSARAPLSPGGLAKRGRVNVVASYPVTYKVFGLTLRLPAFLPTKSVPFAWIDKPVGSCAGNTEQFTVSA